jgi:hypothetical protein
MDISQDYFDFLNDFMKDPSEYDDCISVVSKDNLHDVTCDICRNEITVNYYRYTERKKDFLDRTPIDVCENCKDDPSLKQDKLVHIDLSGSNDKMFLYSDEPELLVYFKVPNRLVVPQEMVDILTDKEDTDFVECQKSLMEDSYERISASYVCHESITNLFDLVPMYKSDCLSYFEGLWTSLLVNCNPESEYYKYSYIWAYHEENQVDIHLLYTADDLHKVKSDLQVFKSAQQYYCQECGFVTSTPEVHKEQDDDLEDNFPMYLYYLSNNHRRTNDIETNILEKAFPSIDYSRSDTDRYGKPCYERATNSKEDSEDSEES